MAQAGTLDASRLPAQNSWLSRFIGNKTPSQEKHHESNWVWGPYGICGGLVAGAIAGMKHDIRWFLWVALPFFALGTWKLTRQIPYSRLRTFGFVVIVISAAIGLYRLNAWLAPVPIPESIGVLRAKTLLSPGELIVPAIEIGSSGVIFTTAIPAVGPKDVVQIGKIYIGAGRYAYNSLKPILDDCEVKVEVIGGSAKLSMVLRDSSGEIVARLTRNEWDWGGRPVSFDRNYNQDSMEIQDRSGNIVLQVTAIVDDIRLQFVSFRKNGNVAYAVQTKPFPTGADDALISFNNTAHDDVTHLIKPMFKYPSSLHLGELAQ